MTHSDAAALSKTTKFLHWILAILIIGLLASGIYMTETKAYPLYDWHKSFGAIASLFVLGRFFWRMKEGWPIQLSSHADIEKRLSRLIQKLLLISPIIMVLSGIVMASFSGHGFAIFDWSLVPRNPDPNNPMQVIPTAGSLSSVAGQIHMIFGYLMVVSLLLHIVGALKHHWVDKDNTLNRMTTLK